MGRLDCILTIQTSDYKFLIHLPVERLIYMYSQIYLKRFLYTTNHCLQRSASFPHLMNTEYNLNLYIRATAYKDHIFRGIRTVKSKTLFQYS